MPCRSIIRELPETFEALQPYMRKYRLRRKVFWPPIRLPAYKNHGFDDILHFRKWDSSEQQLDGYIKDRSVNGPVSAKRISP